MAPWSFPTYRLSPDRLPARDVPTILIASRAHSAFRVVLRRRLDLAGHQLCGYATVDVDVRAVALGATVVRSLLSGFRGPELLTTLLARERTDEERVGRKRHSSTTLSMVNRYA